MLIDRKDVSNFCEELRKSNKKIVFTNGCFDILHVGHIRYLSAAKEFGDILIVGLNTDTSVKSLKGNDRPINNENDRAEVLLALKAIDHVVLFGEKTAEELIAQIKPDIYVKGGDYTLETLPEAKAIIAAGGRIEFIDFVKGKSTTNVISKISQK